MADRLQTARDMYTAFGTGDRDLVEATITDDFTFSAPPDVGLDRAAYFERCWPNAGSGTTFDFMRLFEQEDEVVVTYEATRADGSRFRNTEILKFKEDRVCEAEVYFGWNL